jgi:hypothetical protein
MRGLISAVALVALWFIHAFALKYLIPSDATFGIYEPRREWLIAHVACGTAALLLGPAQFWLALNRKYALWHRILGIGYVMSVGISSVAAIYLALNTDFGWIFGMGMTALALGWIITTGLAVIAICLCIVQQHKEWMIRSYTVTFAFVIFRAIVEVLDVAGVGTTTERLTVASWLCWSVPLLIMESILQGRKMFRPVSAPRQTSMELVTHSRQAQ